jgi:hypothetical protein
MIKHEKPDLRSRIGIEIEECGLQIPNGSTSVLTPALSSRRGRIVRRPFEDLHTWICRTHIRKIKSVRQLFLLPGGEGQDGGGRKAQIKIKRFTHCRAEED